MLEMWGGDRGHFRQAVGWRRPLWLGHWSQQPALGRSGPGHVRDAWKETPAPLVWVEKHPMGLGTGGGPAGGGGRGGGRRPEGHSKATCSASRSSSQAQVPFPPQGLRLKSWGGAREPSLSLSAQPNPGSPFHGIRFTPRRIFSLVSPAPRMRPHERGDRVISVAEKRSHVGGSVTAGQSSGSGGQESWARTQLRL